MDFLYACLLPHVGRYRNLSFSFILGILNIKYDAKDTKMMQKIPK
jgi:hypothetical protein